MRLIDKEKLLEAINEIPCGECDGPGLDECYACVLGRVRTAPSVDAVPVVHGEWTTKRTLQHDGEYYCSRCGFEAFWSWRRDAQSLTNFCPNCGADMRGEDK